MKYLYFILAGYGLFLLLFVLYCAVMHLKHTIDGLPKSVKFMSYQVLFIGLVVDVIFNLIFATVFLLDLPRIHKLELTLTARLKRLKKGKGWRKATAVWLCNVLSNLDPDGYHC